MIYIFWCSWYFIHNSFLGKNDEGDENSSQWRFSVGHSLVVASLTDSYYLFHVFNRAIWNKLIRTLES